MQNRSNRNENRRPYSSQGSYASRDQSRGNGRDRNRNDNFSSYNEDEHVRDYNMDGNSSPRRDWDYEGGTHRAYGRGNRHEMRRYDSDRDSHKEDRYSTNWQATSDYDADHSPSRDFDSRDFNSSAGRGNYSRSYESSRFSGDRESDASTSYGNYSPGRFEGRGPKSYTRSDDRIREDICDMLTRHSEIDAHDIEVEVKGGEVVLSGSVSERRMKHMAEDLVERISAVKDVVNNIRVQRESTHDWSASQTESSPGKRGASNQNSNH